MCCAYIILKGRCDFKDYAFYPVIIKREWACWVYEEKKTETSCAKAPEKCVYVFMRSMSQIINSVNN